METQINELNLMRDIDPTRSRLRHTKTLFSTTPSFNTMFIPVVTALLALSPLVRAGLIHTDKPHEVLDNIHKTPHCAYTCIFDEKSQLRWAPECAGLTPGPEIGACICRANAYQYVLDQCIERKCPAEARNEVLPLAMLILGQEDE